MAGSRRRGAGTTTLTEVAKVAGVSEITVSRVVRGKGPITTETRARVEAAIREVGYVPNMLAGSLASASTALFGIVVPSLGNIVFSDVLSGIDDTIAPQGRRAVVGVTDYDQARETDLVRSLLGWRPAGLVLPGLEHAEETRQTLIAARIPVVEIMDVDGDPIDAAVGIAHHQAGAAMAAHLVSRGYRRFGYVGHDIGRDRRAHKRFTGFARQVAQAGAELVGTEIMPGLTSAPSGREGTARLLARHPRIDAISFSNDDMAIGGYFHCLAHGIAIPGQLALAGFNGLSIAQAMPQPLTTIITHRYEMGRRAGEALIARAAGEPIDRVIDVGFELVAGETS